MLKRLNTKSLFKIHLYNLETIFVLPEYVQFLLDVVTLTRIHTVDVVRFPGLLRQMFTVRPLPLQRTSLL